MTTKSIIFNKLSVDLRKYEEKLNSKQ